MIEVEVHQQLRAFLRAQGQPFWPHHLTMARLVARALRLRRSALIQAGAPSGLYGRYRLSYLMPALIWPEPAVLVASEAVQRRLLMVEIPRLRQWINTDKPIQVGDRWPDPAFQGLLLTTPQAWLDDRLHHRNHFPADILTVIDGAEDLEPLVINHLTAQVSPSDWDALMLACPGQTDAIRDARVHLTRSIFQHPANPYNCYLIEAYEKDCLVTLGKILSDSANPCSGDDPQPQGELSVAVPEAWKIFFHQLCQPRQLVWTEINREQGQFSLHCGPIEVASVLEPIWPQQPIVLIGGAFDLESDAPIYRQRLGLGELTCLKFSPDRQSESIHLYLPDTLPMPNTPQFQGALLNELRSLLIASMGRQGLSVLLIGDVPLKAQVAAVLASEFGSRVQVEKTCLDENGILVTGWEFWREHQAVLPTPHLLVIATLPIPSLEDPLVAGRVADYKQYRQDWFRLYLLPEALSELQRAIAPVRDSQSVVALLDSRVNHRSYGHQVLTALSPVARLNYLDPRLFSQQI